MYSSLKLFPEKDFFLHCSFIFKCGTSEVASSQNPAHRTVSPCDCSSNFSMHFMPYSKFHYVCVQNVKPNSYCFNYETVQSLYHLNIGNYYVLI